MDRKYMEREGGATREYGVWLRPDNVLDLKDQTFILDVAITRDARTDLLGARPLVGSLICMNRFLSQWSTARANLQLTWAAHLHHHFSFSHVISITICSEFKIQGPVAFGKTRGHLVQSRSSLRIILEHSLDAKALFIYFRFGSEQFSLACLCCCGG